MTRQGKEQLRFSRAFGLAFVLTLMLGAVSWGPTVRAGGPALALGPSQQPAYSASGNSLANVFLKPSAVNWGGSATGTVVLLQRTATDKVVKGKLQKAKSVVVQLKSSNSLVKVPASVTMPKGGLSATFPVKIS